jgi:hypothetical protein
VTANISSRTRLRAPLEWLAAIGVAAVLGLGAEKLLRADQPPANVLDGTDVALVRALGGPTGVLAVINPVNCALTAQDAAALNRIAVIPGVRVTVLLLAVPGRDSVMRRVRGDFGFSSHVAVASASAVDPTLLPELFRMPFVALLSGGQLRHAAWGQSLKGIDQWLPSLIGGAQANLHAAPSAP